MVQETQADKAKDAGIEPGFPSATRADVVWVNYFLKQKPHGFDTVSAHLRVRVW